MNCIRYEIYLGLKKKDRRAAFSFEEVQNKLAKFLTKFKIDFSLNSQVGGYIHEDGSYVVEDGIKLTFVGNRSREDENQFFDSLKAEFNQESILVIKKSVDARFEKE